MHLINNFIPDSVRRVHLVAICGTAMGALACMLKDLGYAVTGSDRQIYPPMSRFLAEKRIPVMDGFAPENLSPAPDLVVVGNAVSRDNPEVVRMLEAGLCFCSMPQAINRFIVGKKKSIVVCGTHGKTTTSALAAWILYKAGCDPSFLIGGILKNFNASSRLGKGDVVVLEGDEYDTAFFDKGPKFLHYPPHAAVLTSVEFDHADIFADLDHVKQAFSRYIAGIPADRMIAAFDADENITELSEKALCRVFRYGKKVDSPWRIRKVRIDAPWTRFDVLKDGRHFGRFKTRLPGNHNLLNALAVIAVSNEMGVKTETIESGLATFENVKRRQEVRGIKNGISVIDDFAHHPTAVRETVKALKPFAGSGRLIAVFEPRTNSSMRKVFQDTYPSSFDHADLICIRKPPLLNKIPEAERFSSQKLVADLTARGKSAVYFPDTDEIVAYLVETARPGDTILVMSNGSFDNIHERLLESL